MNNWKKLFVFVALIACVGMASSCNRGVGCPNNFSISK